ncbi:MAG: tRNA uridine-5-carboxymethylaminomethyl(34) synthesis GTPase MnmE [Verrucomicrobiota bacterium]|nr:tRNA uridine-5-carboxymethylaminomethyl(34) synthesis GTPase MnmE [Verrucomicrobiota bacterium]
MNDSIVAISTAPGGAIGIVRISGDDALNSALTIWENPSLSGKTPAPRKMYLGSIFSEKHKIEDRALLVYMPGPNSYTGEDIVELHCHGGILSLKNILELLIKNGLRHAEPGEFTKRAFINGKMDLTQSEAVLDIINAHSSMALHTANKQLRGHFGEQVNEIYEKMQEILAEIEVGMDFAEEELMYDDNAIIVSNISSIIKQVKKWRQTKDEGEILRNGIKIVIVGPPNAGKSSLMNRFLGRERSIVTDIPGTTRDILEEFAHIRGIPLRIFDTAGIRKSDEKIEKAGIGLSLDSIKTANIILWVIDSHQNYKQQALDENSITSFSKTIIICNKTDLTNGIIPKDLPEKIKHVSTSAKTGENFEKLLDAIEQMVWDHPHTEEPDIAINSRHAALLEKSRKELEASIEQINLSLMETAAIHLHAALDYIGNIIGKTKDPDILDNIFSKFCIGK